MSQTLVSLPSENEAERTVVRRLHPLPSATTEAAGTMDRDSTSPNQDEYDIHVTPDAEEASDSASHDTEQTEFDGDDRKVSVLADLKSRAVQLPGHFRALSRRNQILAGSAGVVLALGIVSGVVHMTHSPSSTTSGEEVDYAQTTASVPTTQATTKALVPTPAHVADHPKSPVATASSAPQGAPTTIAKEPLASQAPKSEAQSDDLSAMLAMKKPEVTVAAPVAVSAPVPRPAPPAAETITAPRDPVHVAATLQAAPMSDAQQTQVLGLVTEVAHLVEQQRDELAQLRARLDMEEKAERETEHDLTRRVSLIEAGSAVRDAHVSQQDAATTHGDDIDQARGALASAQSNRISGQAAPASTMPRPSWTPHYRVVAASPQLAMLEDTAAPDGEVARIEAGPGTDLRGLGRILSISQKGTVWVIHTAHGDVF